MDNLFVVCPRCGKEFIRKNCRQKYCSGRCRDSAGYERYITRKVGKPNNGHVSICFDCKHAIGGCKYKPVKGWTVEPSKIYKGGFYVKACPKVQKG